MYLLTGAQKRSVIERRFKLLLDSKVREVGCFSVGECVGKS